MTLESHVHMRGKSVHFLPCLEEATSALFWPANTVIFGFPEMFDDEQRGGQWDCGRQKESNEPHRWGTNSTGCVPAGGIFLRNIYFISGPKEYTTQLTM